MNRELTSVIIPTFNSAEFVIEALDSVAGQKYQPMQVLVVDDGSSDETPELVDRWLVRARASHGLEGRLLRQSHQGAAAARNAALAVANGKWVQFLDSDDVLGPGKIEGQVSALQSKEFAVAYCAWRFLNSKEGAFSLGELNQAMPMVPDADALRMHLEGWYCPPHCYLWPRDLIHMIGGFDASLAADQDGDLMMRALVAGAKLTYCANMEVAYRLHSSSQVSRCPSRSKVRSRLRVARKVASQLEAMGRLDNYRTSIAVRCDELERTTCVTYPEFARVCRRTSQGIAPGRRPVVRGGIVYRLARAILGLYLSEWLAGRKRKLARKRRDT